jgi:hypothetical protein
VVGGWEGVGRAVGVGRERCEVGGGRVMKIISQFEQKLPRRKSPKSNPNQDSLEPQAILRCF